MTLKTLTIINHLSHFFVFIVPNPFFHFTPRHTHRYSDLYIHIYAFIIIIFSRQGSVQASTIACSPKTTFQFHFCNVIVILGFVDLGLIS
ncbi:hypothetical protein QVD17_02037 [Tagetes erecta]|uniref:Uncharacterized protein n=1 Tax=Tagetes erecta TaxID=13708 RepID=A0AAD8L8F4_TARER|nr:hypothetical protein QVD17_02037 [Tagetes erecta]